MTIDPQRPSPKLIETAIPVTEISKASMADKNRKVGTIKNLHKWFATMPTPAMRAVIFCALVDEPEDPAEREHLIGLVKSLVPEDGTPPAEDVLRLARARIRADNPELPVVFDPFAGSGSILVEAQRLGLPVVGSDLNPVAALIARTLAELLPPLADAPAIAPSAHARLQEDLRRPFEGLSADLKYYGAGAAEGRGTAREDLSEAASRRAGSVAVGPDCAMPEPRLRPHVPLFSSSWLSKQKGREATVEAVADGNNVTLAVHYGPGVRGKATKLAGRAQFACPPCKEPFGEREIRSAGVAGKLGYQLLALCVDTDAGRTFLSAEKAPAFDIAPVLRMILTSWNSARIPRTSALACTD